MNKKAEFDIIIEPNKASLHYFKDLWNYRELFFFLAWKEILVRYKQTVIGVAWSVLRPLLTMIVFTIVFGKLANMPSEGVPYPILVYSALLPWQFFSNSFSEASNSLINNANILSKIYFPRLIIPVSTIIVSLIDFLISFGIFSILMLYYWFIPDWKIILLPFFLVLALLTSMGAGLLIATLNVKYRDFRHIVPFIVQFGLYISPVGFSSNIIPDKWRLLYSLNPMAGVIDGFRWILLGKETNLYLPGFIISIILSLILLFISFKYFRSTEKTFADII